MGRFHRHDGEHGHSHTHDGEHWHTHDDGTEHAHADGDHSHDGAADGDVHHMRYDIPPASEANSDAPARDVGDMSGYQSGSDRVDVLERIFDENDRCAAANRADFDRNGVVAINMMSSPGAGKTCLLRLALENLDGSRIGIVEGDIETSLDADRLEGFGAHVSLLNTGDGFGGECHLDAPMVRSALARLPLGELDLVLIENVGNLVCPAEFEVGEHKRAMVYSITEGEEKPLKYPVMFRSADLVLVNKIDLLPYLDFDLDVFYANLRQVNPAAVVIETSAKTSQGVGEWCAWLSEQMVGVDAQ